MELSSLGAEYLSQEAEIKKMIRGTADELKLTFDADTCRELKRRLCVLYTMAGDCRAIGRHLINYYKKEDLPCRSE